MLFTGRCILVFMSACGKAQVSSGMERFNILKPNYTWPSIALYAFIESTESAYESPHFSQVNKKSSVVMYNIFKSLFCSFMCGIVILSCSVGFP